MAEYLPSVKIKLLMSAESSWATRHLVTVSNGQDILTIRSMTLSGVGWRTKLSLGTMVSIYMAVEDEFQGDEEENHVDLYTSTDRIRWKAHGKIKLLEPDGTISLRRAGSPVLYCKDDLWYLFYEHWDEGVWLATTTDPLSAWTNVSRKAVLEPAGLGDFGAMCADSVIKYSNRYYLYGTVGIYPLGTKGNKWAVFVAESDDLINWIPYQNNPITPWGRSSGMPVIDRSGKVRLYTMHPKPYLYLRAATRPISSP